MEQMSGIDQSPSGASLPNGATSGMTLGRVHVTIAGVAAALGLLLGLLLASSQPPAYASAAAENQRVDRLDRFTVMADESMPSRWSEPWSAEGARSFGQAPTPYDGQAPRAAVS